MMALGVSLAMLANDKLSAGTQVFLQQRAHAMSVSPGLKNHPLAKAETVNGKEYIECFIMLDGVTVSELEALGVEVNGRYNKFVTAKIPVDQIERVAEMKGVKQVVIAHNMRLFTDQAANVTNALKAWDGTNYGLLDAYTGKDVVVGLVDIGIEFNHRAFKDANGNTRVKRVYMPNATIANGGSRPSINGTTLSGYHYTTASQISVLTTDYTGESHGTHTSGCATGSKVGNYSGMAPECDIVLCGVGEDGVTDAEMTNCVKYIAEYAKSVGKPCVVSISLGGIFGPHDGTSASCQGYDEVAQEYGAVILLAAGNEADYTAYASKTLSSNNDAMAVIHTPCADFSSQYSNYYGVVGGADFWNSTSDALTVQVRVLNSSGTAVYTSSDMSNGTISASTLSSYYSTTNSQGITIAGAVDAASGRYNLYVSTQLGRNQGSYKLAYIVKGRSGNVISAWTDMQYSEFAPSGTVSGYTLSTGSGEGAFGDDITGFKTISVGAMASRLTVPYNYGSNSGSLGNDTYSEGDVAYFSSYGTDFNGINHPFITAPGHSVVSSLNRYDESGTISANYVSYRQSQGDYYDYWGYMSGTSMATPISAGVVALYLQADPTLDVDGVKNVIANTATAYTNPRSPAMQRGHGIINAVAGIEYIENNTNPVPRIAVDPTELTFSTGVGQSSTKTFTVSGRNLEGRVNLTLNDPSGVFTLSQAYINQSTLANGSKDITVTFSSATEGNFTGSVTLTSTNAESKTVTLTASAHDGGTASDAYLDIAKYATIGEAGTSTTGGWNGNYVNNLYQYTIDDTEGVAWLTLPVYGAWSSVYYQPKYQRWITTTYNSTPGTETMGTASWNATDIYLGSNSYFTSTTARYFGNQSNRATSTRTITFYVTNTTAVKLYGLNNYYGGNNGRQPIPDANRCSMAITECQDNNGSLTPITSTAQTVYGGTNKTATVNISSVELNPEKIYQVVLSTRYTHIYEIGFCTPLPLPGLPTIVSAEPTTTTAEITWTPGGNNDSWNLRWRPYDPSATYNLFWDFEDIEQLTGWTAINNDTDTYNWQLSTGTANGDETTQSNVMTSASWISGVGALSPDNWLITPEVELGGTLTFEAWGQDPNYPSEPFAVYVGPANAQSTSDFTQVMSRTVATADRLTYTVDLSRYAGQTGHIAFRHYDITDMFRLNLDNVKVAVPGGVDQPAWTRVDNVTSPYTITGLTPATTYEVQVMGENQYYYGYWTPSTIFTTLSESVEATLAQIETSGIKNQKYKVSDKLLAVYAAGDEGILWCKDLNNVSIAPTYQTDGQYDYMRDIVGEQSDAWDQSNWVALQFSAPTSSNGVKTLIQGAVGSYIKAGTIVGTYSDLNNYTITMAEDALQLETCDEEYVMNVYSTANFLPGNLNINGGKGAPGRYHGKDVYYFFMNPKVQEVCEITYALWDGEKFVVPENDSQIDGAFTVDWSHNEEGAITPTTGEAYRFIAVVNRTPNSGYLRSITGEPSSDFIVSLLNFTGTGDQVITAINGIYTDGYREVVGVDYVNVAGMISDKPFQGVNIVVTRYSDGSKTTEKKVFK